jgi:hypothetical protein
MDFFDKLSAVYNKYNTQISLQNDIPQFEIINPHKQENIIVTSCDDELTFYFSYQHAHFQNDIKELISYIDCFLSDEYVALEFFDGENNLFGGGVSLQDIDIFSVNELAARFGYNLETFDYIINQSKCRVISYKACCWSGLYDADVTIRKKMDDFIVERIL